MLLVEKFCKIVELEIKNSNKVWSQKRRRPLKIRDCFKLVTRFDNYGIIIKILEARYKINRKSKVDSWTLILIRVKCDLYPNFLLIFELLSGLMKYFAILGIEFRSLVLNKNSDKIGLRFMLNKYTV